ncbi:MAG: hypothetical protein GX670_06125 [Bacteroidales bacterium]|nr:hypothetical protein [Bacteroidales bacterium]
MKTYKLFNEINQTLFKGTLTNKQKEGINYKLKAFDKHDITDDRWRAYMLATSFHETARTMQPIEERGKGAGKPYGQRRKYSGAIYAEPDKLFFGRGDVQLTWYENYEMMGRLLDLPLLEEPELALNPLVSARIMIEGMTRGRSNRGDFTGVSLENYFNANKEDPFNARRIINGLDCAKLIEGYYRKFLSALRMSALRNSGLILVFVFVASSLLMLGGCKPKQVVNEQYVAVTDSTAVFQLSDSLQIKEWQMSVLRTHLNRFIEENFNLESKMWQKEIYYDTSAVADSVSGKHPVLSEIVSTNIITLEKSSINNEALMSVDSIVGIKISELNSNIDLKVEKLVDENKSVETITLSKTSMKYKWVVLLIILFIVLILKYNYCS